ncbi:hypothetical protein WJ90_23385 [Burkholderia ubonensis]|nr:hypothetical protein WJ90_23385 [Burkholderia ubonensis]KVR60005.1 hypothetical protein WK16_20230 [Burkholderia ubonensis]OJB26419.1 hypothetical protein BGV48_05175 [Burkholderia ubonensis]
MLIERAFAQAGVKLNIAADIDSLPAELEIAHTGNAYAILPSAGQLVLVEHPPVSPAALAVRRCIAELVFELHESGKWPGITLRSALQ